MKHYSWNVNGLRAIHGKGFLDWVAETQAECIGLQEIKAHKEQVHPDLYNPLKMHSFWNPAKKPGYSGTLIYTKREPLDVEYGMGVKEFDDEGRVLAVKFREYTFVNAYFPNSQEAGARLDFKVAFCKTMHKYLLKKVKKGENVILCGDYNIAHTEIDLKNPKANTENPGFFPQEREWMTEFLSGGFSDVFRKQHPGEKDHYTWWSYRMGARARNVGWRIDYHCVNNEFEDRVKSSVIHSQVMGSDHCPVELILKK